jgi:hypothetical protein
MKDFQQHKFLLCLDSPLYLAVIKFQAEHELGRSYAALSIFVEGLKALNLISQDLYEYYKQKYGKPLKPDFILEDKRPKCSFCGKPAAFQIRYVKNPTIIKQVCEKHLNECLIGGKWERLNLR